MKIGIISYWNTRNNYGQLLQCFAVQQLIKILGHNPTHIRYVSLKRSFFLKILSYLKICLSSNVKSLYKSWKERKIKNNMWKISQESIYDDIRNFDMFRDKYLSFTVNSYSEKDLIKNPPIFEAYICGSDQIWGGPSIPYMLQFGPKSSKRLSIAASMGGVNVLNKHQISLCKKYLNNFDYISLREERGAELIRSIGRNDIETVLDPTLYLRKEVYKSITKNTVKEDYVFLYLLGSEMVLGVEEIFKWAKEKDLQIVYVVAQGRTDDYEKIYPTINEWLGYIENAKYIITNSFHGMAMSIVFEKQFLVIPLTSIFTRMNDRFIEVMGQFNLNSRLFSGNLDEIIKPIDYTKITEKRLNEANHFLKKIDSILKS